ncbi:PDR/VanB family oxidoreductase [Corynebacterium sp.]|uniref:PDR/VanB family oxidoreductase n=1 Tax=Corynebacterium sp. TaxID=1720 RepID=UPI0028B01581|nr:PDR/VanB family oxidoreductase [Corynebacterium sp.]
MSDLCTIPVMIRSMRVEAEGVLSLELIRTDGSDLPEWTPGAHVDVAVGDGLIRQYSLCSDPADTGHYRIAVLREVVGRGGSRHVHDVLRPGDEVVISEPRNNFEVSDNGKPLILIAGGIGITPILAMARAAAASGREFHLYYGGRSRASMAFLDELSELSGRLTVTSDDREGVLDLDTILDGADSGEREVYVCGPGGLLDAVEKRADDWPAGTFHCERFVARTIEPPPEGEREFTVRCIDSDVEVNVPVGCTIMEQLEAAGIDVPHSCREGTCGTCETDIISGVPDHRDSLLSSEERESGETMLLCVSRAKTDVLELEI